MKTSAKGLVQESGHPAGRRRPVMTLVMLLIPVVFFGLLEAGLRLAGYGNSYPVFITAPGFDEYLLPNPDLGERYFARTRAVPGPAHDAFRAVREVGSLRLFVQGESSAAGFPYRHGGAFPRILGQRIGQSLPNREIEIVNTSMDAVSSTVLVDLVDDIIEQSPDAVLIYAGHNEYYGALGVASTESLGEYDSLVRLYLALDSWRTVQALRAVWAWVLGPVEIRGDSETPTLMEELAGDQLIPPGSELRRAGEERFRANLTRMLCAYRDAGVPAFVGTLVSNERGMAPLVSRLAESTDSMAWAAARSEVMAIAAGGDFAAVLPVVDRWVAVDTSSAIARYERATLLERLGRSEDALAEYRAAVDLDALPFRAPGAMNSIIRETAALCGATVVDTRAVLGAAAPNGIIGNELILEHLHPNVDGYFLIADAYFRALAETGVLGTLERRIPLMASRREVLVTELDSTLASLHVRRLLNSWPFRPETVEDTFKVAHPIDALAVDVLAGRMSWDVAMGRLGAFYEEQGDWNRALQVALAMVQEYPYRGGPLLMTGHVLARQGRLPEALRFFLAAGAREPSVDALRLTGQTMTRLGKAEEALRPLEEARTLAPEDVNVLYDLGVAYITLGRKSDAMRAAQQILQIKPDHPGALRLFESASAED